MTKTISFVLEGQTLRLSSDAPVQYSDEIAVEIGLDADYAQATDVALITQPEGRSTKPARSILTISGRMAQGTIKRKQLMQDGTVLFVLAGKIGDAVLPTAACYVQVQRSADPQAESYVDDPETIVDVIGKVVAEKGGLPSTGYDGVNDLGKIAVINKDGELAVRNVHLLIDDDTDGGSLVLRGAVGQVIASITTEELADAILAPVEVKNSYWSGYKYQDGRAILEWKFDVQNKALKANNGVYITDKLFNSQLRKYPDVFIEKPEFRATYAPSPNRVHVSAYATFQRGNSEQSSGSGGVYYYQTPPDVYIVCGDNTSTTLLGELHMVAEGRWK